MPDATAGFLVSIMIISNQLFDIYHNIEMDTLISSPHNPELPAWVSELVYISSVTAKLNGLANHFAKLRATDHKLIIANED